VKAAKTKKAGKPTQSASNPPKLSHKITLPDLPPRAAVFIDNYMINFNGTQAAIAAGYTKASAANAAHRLLRNDDVRTEISRRRHANAEAMEAISKERVMYELASVGLSNMGEMAPMFGDGDVAEKMANLTRTQAAAVKEIVVEEFRDGRSDWRTVRRTKFKLHDKGQSLRLLSEMNGWVVDKVDVKHTHTGTILHAMLREIAEEEAGKPIVDVEPVQIEDKGKAA
jgi:phage terminase small subunit